MIVYLHPSVAGISITVGPNGRELRLAGSGPHNVPTSDLPALQQEGLPAVQATPFAVGPGAELPFTLPVTLG
jgi:hypothetical protein